ncbi:MAG: hypothetical protein ACFFDC_01055 [Promethearchaeota archaeon]
MRDINSIKKCYNRIMDCNKNCPMVVKNDTYPPRGYWFDVNNNILVVGLNPGKFDENSDEFGLYNNKQGPDLVETQLNYVEKRFTQPNKIYYHIFLYVFF